VKKLSEKQSRMLRFTGEFMDEHGLPPTVRDIQYGCDISSTSVVDYNLRILERDGYIRRSPEISRGLELVDGSRVKRDTVSVPLIGEIAAGQPIPVLAPDDFDQNDPLDMLDVAKGMLHGERDVYALRVRGLSMIDALIDDGDVIVVKPAADVRDGEMVVAWLTADKEATLKRFYYEGEKVRLQPANSQMPPIYVDRDAVEIQGKVVAVLRNLT